VEVQLYIRLRSRDRDVLRVMGRPRHALSLAARAQSRVLVLPGRHDLRHNNGELQHDPCPAGSPAFSCSTGILTENELGVIIEQHAFDGVAAFECRQEVFRRQLHRTDAIVSCERQEPSIGTRRSDAGIPDR
jgi:hypothetical protein